MKSSIYFQRIKFDIGELKIAVHEDHVVICDWQYRKMRSRIDERISKGIEASFTEGYHPLIDETHAQIQAYLKGELQSFSLPLKTVGTDFQKKVWEQLQQIPYGSTASYLSLSHQLHQPKAIRAVASANGANAHALLIPCHRVIGAQGDLVGYAGGITVKKKLLELEGALPKISQMTLF